MKDKASLNGVFRVFSNTFSEDKEKKETGQIYLKVCVSAATRNIVICLFLGTYSVLVEEEGLTAPHLFSPRAPLLLTNNRKYIGQVNGVQM